MKPGDKVTIGLSTHSVITKVWLVFPAIGITHEVDELESTPTCTRYKEVESNRALYEEIHLEKLHPKPKPPNQVGTVIDSRVDDWGQTMVLLEYGPQRKQRWFMEHFLNCQHLTKPIQQPMDEKWVAF